MCASLLSSLASPLSPLSSPLPLFSSSSPLLPSLSSSLTSLTCHIPRGDALSLKVIDKRGRLLKTYVMKCMRELWDV